MKMSKDIQEVLEGVHHFLSVTLTCESLSGASDSERRSLMARIDTLSHTHPSLTLIRPQSAASLPYLPMDNPPVLGLQQQHPSESSSGGSSNTYSNSTGSCGGGGSSGDGLVLPRVPISGLVGSHTLPSSFQVNDELYEEFEENREEEAVQNGRLERRRVDRQSERWKEEMEEKDDAEEVYMESVEAVPFSTIIATCEKHGVLAKRTKGLLRNLKSYHTVATNGRLYLYLRDTDERQRKTLDLMGYTVRSATGDDIKDQRKKDAALELVGPGKKTHTFIARTARDKMDWLEAIERTMKPGCGQTSANPKIPIIPSFHTPTASSVKITTSEGIMSQNGSVGKSVEATPTQKLLGPAPPSSGFMGSSADVYFYYHDVAEDERDEVYEEIDADGHCDTLPPPPPSLLSPSPPPPRPPNLPPSSQSSLHPSASSSSLLHPSTSSPSLANLSSPPPLPPHTSLLPCAPSPTPPSCPPPPPPEELPDYDPVGSEEPVPPPLPITSAPKPNRPPLPAVIQNRVNLCATRPLPDAPYEHEDSDDIIGIYCEIDDDILETAKQNYEKALQGGVESKSWQEVEGSNVNKEVKTIGNSGPALPDRGSGNSLVGYLSDEVLQNISDFKTSSPVRYPSSRTANTPPKLPPKGLPPVIDDDDSEYKVPTTTHDNEYQVPSSNPVPTSKEGSPGKNNTIQSITGPMKSVSELYQVPPTQTIVSIMPGEKRRSIVKEDVKPMSSFFSENPYSKTSFRSLTKRFENQSESMTSSGENKLSQGTSVKDMVARLNKNKTNSDSSPTKAKEDPLMENSENNNNDGELQKCDDSRTTLLPRPADGKLSKPSLPPRPANLVNGGAQLLVPSISSKQRNSGTSEEADNSDDNYETPDDPSGGNDVAQYSTSTAETGDWYVAKFAFVASIDQALSFSRGEELFVYDTSSASGWWRARLKGQSGLVPREYLRKRDGATT